MHELNGEQPGHSQREVVWKVPSPFTPLIGRGQDVTSVCVLLSRPEVRLLTLLGVGGIGKTRLSIQVANQMRDRFADGVCFVGLAPLSDPSLVISSIAHELGLQETGAQPLVETVKAWLQNKHFLLLLDNFEQIVRIHDEAYTLYNESLSLGKEVGDKKLIASCLEGLAEVATAQQESAWAARLWGAAEVLLQATGTIIPPIRRAAYERSVAAVRTHLGKQAFAAAWDEGRNMTPEQALAAQGTTGTSISAPIEPPSTPPAKTSPTYPAGLTAREVEVLRLVAQGLSDAQVAEQLVVSPRTVNFHVNFVGGPNRPIYPIFIVALGL